LSECEYCNLTFKHQRIVLENEYCLYLQLLKPDIEGSGIILKESKEIIDNEFKPDGYNVGWNCGSVGGQHIFHSHLHVIPRFADEPFAGKGIRNWFKSKENKRTNTF